MRLAKWRNHESRDAESIAGEISRRIGRRWIGWRLKEILGRNAIRTYNISRRGDVIIKSAMLVECQDEDRIFPRGALHKCRDQRGGKGSARLDVVPGMFILAYRKSGIDVGHCGQRAVLQVREVLRDGNDVCRMFCCESGEESELGILGRIGDVDLPGDILLIEQIKYRLRSYRRT